MKFEKGLGYFGGLLERLQVRPHIYFDGKKWQVRTCDPVFDFDWVSANNKARAFKDRLNNKFVK